MANLFCLKINFGTIIAIIEQKPIKAQIKMKKYVVNIDVDEDAIRETTKEFLTYMQDGNETNLEDLIKVVLGWSEGIYPRSVKEQAD